MIKQLTENVSGTLDNLLNVLVIFFKQKKIQALVGFAVFLGFI